MTTERLDIKISEDGSRVVKRNIESIGDSSEKASKGVGMLQRALGGIAGALGVRQIAQYASTWVDLNSRVVRAAGSMQNAGAVMNQLVDIARRTYSNFENTAEIFLRNSDALTELGYSTQKQIDFTEAMTNALVVSGAKGQQAETVINALSKGMMQGALKGMNWQTVLQQGGRVVTALADGLGVTTAELRRMATEGQLTTTKVMPALLSQLEKLRKEADDMPATISDVFVNLRTSFIQYIGMMDEALGVTTGFGQALTGLIKDFTLFSSTVTSLSVTLAVLASGKVLGAVYTGIKGITLAMRANPMGALISAIQFLIPLVSGLVTWFVSMDTTYDNALKNMGKSVTVIDKLRATWVATVAAIETAWSNLWPSLQSLAIDGINSIIKGMGWLGAKVNGIINSIFKTNLNTDSSVVNSLLIPKSKDVENAGKAIANSYADAYKTEIMRLAKAIPKLTGGSTKGVTIVDPEETKKLKQLQQALDSLISSLDSVAAAEMAMTEAQVTLSKAREKGLITAEKEAKYLERVAEYYQDALDPVGAINREMEQQISLLKMSSGEREIESKMLGIVQGLREKGVVLMEGENQKLREQLRLQGQLNTMNQTKESLLRGSVGERTDFKNRVSALSGAGPGPGFTEGDRAKAVGGELQNMGINVDGLQVGMKAQEAVWQGYYDNLKILRDADLLSQEDYAAASAQIEWQRESLMLGYADKFFGNLAVLSESGNKKVAAIGRAAAISQATIAGYVAVQEALRGPPGPPWSYGIAASAGVVAAANVAKIAGVGFAQGGYTGNAGVHQVAGLVHGQEFVANADATRRNRGALEAMNRGAELGGSTQLDVQIVNQIPNAEFEVNQIDDNRVEIIARRVVREESDGIVATNLRNPNSRTSKSLAQNTKTVRSY